MIGDPFGGIHADTVNWNLKIKVKESKKELSGRINTSA
jgi:hypothetical protein